MECDAADYLHVEVAHACRAHRGLAREREDFGQNAVERLLRASLALLARALVLARDVAYLIRDLPAKLRDARAHLVVPKLLHAGFETAHARDEGLGRREAARL